jgi:hypothetical protein
MNTPITVEQLSKALIENPWNCNSIAVFLLFDQYCKQRPTPDAIPVLRQALHSSYHGTVRCAAHSLKKLGPVASEAMDDLLLAAAHVDVAGMPQAYPQCIAAMIAIEPHHPELLPLIRSFMDLDNWGPISASMKALKYIGTPQSEELLQHMAILWLPKLNKM